MSGLTDQEVIFTLIACAAHDIDHPGNTNIFEIKNRSKLAMLYNDQSVLENHHAASLFFLLENNLNDCNIFSGLSKDELNIARKVIIECILSTDNSKHAAI